MGINFRDLLAFCASNLLSEVLEMQLCYIYTRYIQSFPKTPFLIYMQYYNVAMQSCRNEAMKSQNLYIWLESILLVYRSKKSLSFLDELQSKMIRMNTVYHMLQSNDSFKH